MKEILGFSAFGYNDCIAADASFYYSEQVNRLRHALLPNTFNKSILFGNAADNSRIHTGISWPPEATLKPDRPIRRVPIPYIWRALVEAGDRTAKWDVGRGTSFSLTKILAQYLVNYSESKSKLLKNVQPVIVIPDNLDEFGQESLIRELASQGTQDAWLLWRPVAASLSWLEFVGDEFVPQRMHDDDHIHVIYMGADSIEMNTLRLRHKIFENQGYILPLRDRPKRISELTGFDWAGNIITKIMPYEDQSCFWQIFSLYSDIWKLIANSDVENEKMVLSVNNVWQPWTPALKDRSLRYSCEASPCRNLRKILNASCPLNDKIGINSGTVHDFLEKKFGELISRLPKGKLCGVVLTGPLCEQQVPSWVKSNKHLLEDRGINCFYDTTEPAIGGIWIKSGNDMIANGARIYGEKTLREIPAYLDTMPQISLLAKKGWQNFWFPLLNAEEVVGGQMHSDILTGKFMLGQNQSTLDTYLYKGSIDEAELFMNQKISFDASNKFVDISYCQKRLVRELVKSLGSLERAHRNNFLNEPRKVSKYGLAYAESMFASDLNENAHAARKKNDTLSNTAIRTASFNFMSSPPEDVALDIHVSMKPASGLARIEIVPENNDFIKGRRVRFDYAKMKVPSRLPQNSRGWPRLQELAAEPEDLELLQRGYIVSQFENVSPTSQLYLGVADNVRNNILKFRPEKQFGAHQLYVYTIDETGQACTAQGNKLIGRISNKFKRDFLNPQVDQNKKNRIFSRAAWCYWKTPDEIIEYIRNMVQGIVNTQPWLWAVDAASRSFQNVSDYQILIKSVCSRIYRNSAQAANEPFPINAARACLRLLMFREDGEKALDKQSAHLIAKNALERMLSEQKNNNYQQIYFQMIALLLYLLRYRRIDNKCFNPDLYDNIYYFEDAIESMEEAEKYFISNLQTNKARKIKIIYDGFEKYLYYEGDDNLPSIISGELGDMR
ncbi:hypothetical protein [Desulfonatronovibrio magnus]|uniref:hypothetical protein n=1 Tax=Desulfonatronovibrio magnus TaxID=698827 RepID=UPI0005EBAFE1|nr:hypothetical protein [Desulfonatronovibrio magnus]